MEELGDFWVGPGRHQKVMVHEDLESTELVGLYWPCSMEDLVCVCEPSVSVDVDWESGSVWWSGVDVWIGCEIVVLVTVDG